MPVKGGVDILTDLVAFAQAHPGFMTTLVALQPLWSMRRHAQRFLRRFTFARIAKFHSEFIDFRILIREQNQRLKDANAHVLMHRVRVPIGDNSDP